MKLDLTGLRYGRLTAVHLFKDGRWVCRCDCGGRLLIWAAPLRSGHARSCGCLHRERRVAEGLGAVGGSAQSEYGAYLSMRRRCLQPAHPDYRFHGARGINVCAAWLKDYGAFLRDMGPRPSPKHVIERLDKDGDYMPSNCRWGTPPLQTRKARCNSSPEWEGMTATLVEWASPTATRGNRTEGVNRQ